MGSSKQRQRRDEDGGRTNEEVNQIRSVRKRTKRT